MAAPNTPDGITSLYVHPGTLNVGIGTSNPRAKLEVAGNILPSSNMAYDIGSSNLRFRDIYLSGNTIDLGGTAITRDANTGGIKVSDPASGGAPLDLTVKNLVASNVSVIGDFVTLNTVTSNTEQVVITNAGTGPALKVTQTGAQPIADFYDDGGVLALRVADGGNVGIGTGTPLQALHVQGAVQAHTQFLGQQSDTVTAPSFSWAGDTNTGLYLPATDQIGVVTAGAERMRVAANGTVGIGTTNIVSRLTVYENSTSSDQIRIINQNASGRAGISILSSTAGFNIQQTPAGSAVIENYANNSTGFYQKEGGSFLFHTTNNNNVRMVIGNDGNVGIGATNPQAKLDVRGNFYCPGCVIQVVKNARSDTIDGGSWGGYSLTSTSEVTILNPLITITPKYSNSLIVFNVSFSGYHVSNDFYTSVYIRRNAIGTANKISSSISSANGSINWGEWTMNFGAYNSISAHAFWHFSAWDQPNTISPITYILTGANHQASKTFIFWSPYGVRITAMEIAQ